MRNKVAIFYWSERRKEGSSRDLRCRLGNRATNEYFDRSKRIDYIIILRSHLSLHPQKYKN